MKLNERSVAGYATGLAPADHAGFLQQRSVPAPGAPSHRRWFVLKGNLLFYFEERASRAPLGLIVLEGCTVELCEADDDDFAFAVRFDRVPGARPYVLAADGPAALEAWVKALSRASFGYMRLLVQELERQLEEARLGGLPRTRSAGRGAALRRSARVSARRDAAPGGEDGSAGPPKGDPNSGGPMGEPPPLPPPRHPTGRGSLPALGESPVSPETACFARLHDWFGQEIAELRREWRAQRRGQS
ncbi:sesquipedalian-2 [Ornithorhynchus anatinus]|uniref:Sesquipedalian n=1 Tax=Ornithorhynchus anatinus TaxID=9258 RepID=F7BJX6_ORNAN|nr:sesquipedalian-2 [Ornithorhynchus anatinus]